MPLTNDESKKLRASLMALDIICAESIPYVSLKHVMRIISTYREVDDNWDVLSAHDMNGSVVWWAGPINDILKSRNEYVTEQQKLKEQNSKPKEQVKNNHFFLPKFLGRF